MLLFARSFVLAAVLLWCLPTESAGQLSALETKHLRLVHFSIGHEYLVPHVARCFEIALDFHSRLFKYTPSEPVTVLIQDFGDFGNGGATGVPKNLISVGISPFHYCYETMPAVERMSWMMNHELVHIVTMDQPSPSSAFFRSVFGGKIATIPEAPLSLFYGYLTSPRLYAPSWFLEGQAVFMETWMNGGLGRAMGAYDEMMFRTMVRDNSYFYDVVGLESEGTKVDFQVGANSYLYGTRFMSYLALQHGPEKVVAWNNHDDQSSNHFASRFREVFGTPLDEEWSRWTDWEHTWQNENLASIRTNPVTPYRVLSQTTLGSVSRPFLNKDRSVLYAAVNYPGQVAHLAALDLAAGSKSKLHDVRGGALFYVTSVAYDSDSGVLFFSTDNNRWRDLNSYDLKTGKSRLLLKDCRTGDFVFNASDRSLWGVRHYNGISSLVRIPHPYKEWNLVYAFPYGKDIFDLEISPDGSLLTAALAELDGTQKLIAMKTDFPGSGSYDILYDFDISTPANFVFSQDGKHLFGSSYYSGVSNIVRYDFETKEVHWLTNCETGLFRPTPVSNDSLVAFMYTGQGFVPVMIANQPTENVSAIRYLGNEVAKRHPVVQSWHVRRPTLANVNLDSLTVYRGEYKTEISLLSAYPVVEGFKNFAAYGFRFNLADPISSHSVDITASYTPNRILPSNERFHAVVNFRFWEWKMSATMNGADFYDLFGPTKTSRKGYSASVQYKDYAIFDEPETMDYRFTAAAYWGLERLPEFQNVVASFDKFWSLNAQINYRNLSNSLGAVENEKGLEWQAVSHANVVLGKTYPRISTHLSYGFLLPINHSSVWLRSAAGFSIGDQANPFANFYFGGFGNNWVDIGKISRYREDRSFPGLAINQIGGINYFKTMVEWNLPPVRFRRLGFQSFYSNWSRLSLFAAGLETNIGQSAGQRAVSAGMQLDFRLVLLSSFESTFSLGYALAAERNHRPSDEFMVSLKILR
ncbi:MAG: hypothetical protein WEB37_07720 [Bacteroidota bacterium]